MNARFRFQLILAVLGLVFGIGSASQVASRELNACTPSDSLVAVLARAYSDLDYECYATLFASEAAQGVDFRFILFTPDERGEKEWGYAEEMRIHRRMFRPAALEAGDGTVPPHLWVRSIACTLVPQESFTERFDLYRSEQDPTAPLDRHRWRAMSALHSTAVVWHLASGATFSIAGLARFVVIEDRALPPGAPAKYFIYCWEDLGPGDTGIAQATP